MSRVTLELCCCSFCGNTEHQVVMMTAGPGDVFICDLCIEEAMSILLERRIKQRDGSATKEGE